MSPKRPELLKDFLWGAATAAHQVEGHQHNNWSVWEAGVADQLADGAKGRLAKKIPDWSSVANIATYPTSYISGNAADHYNRYEEDFDLLKSLGCNAYRFSIEWARIEPTVGSYDQAELAHYQRVVAALKKRDIEPLVTLHHFSNPTWLEDHGGWHGKEVATRFADYTQVVARKLGKGVISYCTINEPGSYLLMRYTGGGAWPEWPKIETRPLRGHRYLKNVIKAHKLASEAIKSVNPEAKTGLAHGLIDYQLGRHDPVSYLFKRLLDSYPDGYLLKHLKDDLDFIGVNYYMRMQIKAGLKHPQKWAPKWNGEDPQNDMGWGIYPEGLYNVTQKLKKYNLPMIITENGIPDAADKHRSQFIKDHIAAMKRSIKDGADIRGYFHWSLLDNYEWSEGYWPKFGLASVDLKTQKRAIRPSAKDYSKIIKQHSK